MLSKTMIKAFKNITGGKIRAKQLTQTMKIKESWCIKILKKLAKEDLITLRKKRGVYIAKISSSAQAQSLKELISREPSINFDQILDKNKGRILQGILYTPKTVSQIAKQLKIGKKTVGRAIKKFLNQGLVLRGAGKHKFHKKFWPHLYDFLNKYRNRAKVKGNLLWQFEGEVVFEVRRREDISGVLTGTSRYDDYQVPVMVSKYCCYYPKKALSKEEIFIHSILQIEKDPRAVGLAAVFFLKNELSFKKIQKLAFKYDCLNKVKEILAVIKSGGKTKTKTIPNINTKELQKIYDLYNVKKCLPKKP